MSTVRSHFCGSIFTCGWSSAEERPGFRQIIPAALIKSNRLRRSYEPTSIQDEDLCFCRDTEAMRIAVVVGKEKLRLPVVSVFEF